ncbi:serine/threonine protein kinase [Thermogemmatispora onikobensis]|uniref:serine/threonine protein kinase n=1 Tax=Thermogemmatispora onikobensis TaxID=732234 RepID=UPI0008539F5C|nr:serine/threonine-protein kinase [Thermogemmatispora onikobensis]
MSTIPRRIGRYGLQQQLGSGSLGEVWMAYDLERNQVVALKLFHSDLQADPNFLARFQQAGQMLSALHHPNIVSLLGFEVLRVPETNSTTACMALEYVEGETLANYIQHTLRKGLFPPISALVYLFKALGAALDYAHQQGIIHGGLKPSNILLDQRHALHSKIGEPRITDFGLATLFKGTSSLQSALYISPEQARGQPPTERSDIYSLGVILYELCTGVQPFRSESAVALMMQHINVLPTPPILINSSIPPGLSEVILRAIAKDPATRFRSASALAEAVAEACAALPTGQLSLGEELLRDGHGSEEAPSALSGPLPAATAQTTRRIPVVTPESGAAPSTPLPAPVPARFPQPLPPAPPVPALPPATTAVLPAVPARGRGKEFPLSYAIISGVVLCIIILGASVASLWPRQSQPSSQPAATPSVPGYVFFQDDALGHADVLRIEISGLSAPAANQAYYAWMQASGTRIIPLGKLALSNGKASLVYPGDAQHTNLLSQAVSFFITLEDAQQQPQAPSGSRLYAGNLNRAALPYLQHLLYMAPGLPEKVGIAVEMFETIKSINEKAGSIVDDLQGPHDYGLAWRQANRIITMIDGSDYARSSGDLPADQPTLLQIPIGLISSPSTQGYLDMMASEISHLQEIAGQNSTMLQHIQHINNALSDLRQWVANMRTYSAKLAQTPLQQMGSQSALDLALQLKKAAADSYTGRVIPPNDQPTLDQGSAGMYQAYIECQYLAAVPLQKV